MISMEQLEVTKVAMMLTLTRTLWGASWHLTPHIRKKTDSSMPQIAWLRGQQMTCEEKYWILLKWKLKGLAPRSANDLSSRIMQTHSFLFTTAIQERALHAHISFRMKLFQGICCFEDCSALSKNFPNNSHWPCLFSINSGIKSIHEPRRMSQCHLGIQVFLYLPADKARHCFKVCATTKLPEETTTLVYSDTTDHRQNITWQHFQFMLFSGVIKVQAIDGDAVWRCVCGVLVKGVGN